MRRFDRRAVLAGAGLALSANRALAALPAWAAAGDDPALRDVIDNGPRSAADRARDVYRHPYASLIFWGLRPGMTVIDVDPGAGWWTDILAPYLARTHGRYVAAVADLNDPKVSDEGRKARAAFEAKYAADPKLKDVVSVVGFGRVSGALAPSGSVDLVLVSRETHNWVRPPGFMQKARRLPRGAEAGRDPRHRGPPRRRRRRSGQGRRLHLRGLHDRRGQAGRLCARGAFGGQR
jgi:predicted methyltransferase